MGAMVSHAFAEVRAAMLALALGVIALPPASAQQADIAASQKRFNDLYAKGDYPAALVEAQKLESPPQAVVSRCMEKPPRNMPLKTRMKWAFPAPGLPST